MTKRCFIFVVTILSGISLYGQGSTSHSISFVKFLESYSASSGIQFAYNPELFSGLTFDDNENQIGNLNDFKKLLSDSNIEVEPINKERWLLKAKSEIKLKEEPISIISGVVQEDESNPLISALIFTSDSKYSSLTDEAGNFVLNVPNISNYEVCCQYLGYKVQCIKSENIKNNSIEFELEPQTFEIKNVIIQSKRVQFKIERISDSEMILINNSAVNRSTLGKDVLRSVQMLSGVDATNDLKSSLSIRGSSDLQSLITLDGIPVYNPESSFGIFSAINPLVVQKAQLYKNAMPLEYGEFTGAYLACDGLNTQQDKLGLDVDISTLKSAAAIQIPITKNAQISAAIRSVNGKISNRQFYSSISPIRKNNPQSVQFFNRPEKLNTSLENKFGDFYLNAIVKGKNNTSFKATFFGNRDLSGTSYENDYFFIKNNGNNNRLTINEMFVQEQTKANVGLSFNYSKKYESNALLTLLFYSSRYKLLDIIDADVSFLDRVGKKINLFDSRVENTIKDSDIKLQYNTDETNLFSWKYGFDLRRLSSNLVFRSNSENGAGQNIILPSITPYFGFKINIEEQIIIDFGNRTAIIPLNQKLTSLWSPRMNASFRITDELYFKTSISHNEQYFRPLEMERQLGQSISANVIANNALFPIMKSNQVTGGFNFSNGKIGINGDVYIRKNLGIIEQVLNVPGINENESNIFGNNKYILLTGENRVIGADVTTSFEFQNFSGLLSYTLSKSEDRFKALYNNKYLNDQNNRLHQLNLLGTYNFKNWTFSSTYIYGSGVYTLNRAELDQLSGREKIDPKNLFKQLPDYNRWDLNTSYKIDSRIGNIYIDLSVFNVLNYENINSEIYIYKVQDGVDQNRGLGATEVNLLDRIWTLGVRFSL